MHYMCNLLYLIICVTFVMTKVYCMQERFKQLLEEKNLTATRFAAMIKVNASAMSHILNGRSKPGFDVLDKIAQAFPDVNLNWLISGKGSIYNTSSNNKPQPVQKSLFEEEIKAEKATQVAAPPATSPVDIQTVLSTVTIAKKLKRIILFFEDGSFEDYTNTP